MPGYLELAAMLFTVICILLANIRNIWTYPVGLVGTVLYFFVLLPISLPLALLQVVFTIDQLYGWWFWLRGDKGREPRISSFGIGRSAAVLAVTASVGYGAGIIASGHPNLMMGPLDTAILTTSLLAQFFLDRKIVETWAMWLLVNAVSVYYYATVSMMPTAILSAILLINAFYGYYLWLRELRSYGDRPATPFAVAQGAV